MTHPFFVRQVAVDIEPEVAGALVQLATRLSSLLFLLLLGRHNGTGTVKKKVLWIQIKIGSVFCNFVNTDLHNKRQKM